MIVRINIEGATPAVLLAIAAAMGQAGHEVQVVDDNQKNGESHPAQGFYQGQHNDFKMPEAPVQHAPQLSVLPVPGYQEQGTPDEFNPAQAAAIFGVHAPNVPAPAATGATAHPFVSGQPVHPAVGGTQGGAVEVDSAGHVWDARIHSSSREKLVKDQTWKLKRNVDQNLVAQIRAGATPQTVPITRFNDQPVPPAPIAAGPTYGDVCGLITSLAASGRVPAATSAGLLQHNGIPDMQALASHSDKWAHIISELNRLAGGA